MGLVKCPVLLCHFTRKKQPIKFGIQQLNVNNIRQKTYIPVQ